MNLLMISGDRALAAGKRGAFYNTLEQLHRHFGRIDIICPKSRADSYELSVFGNVFVHPSPWPLPLQWFWIRYQGRRLARQREYGIMTVHEYAPVFNGVGARWLNRSTGIPYILEVMHVPGMPRAAGLWELMDRWLTRLFISWTARSARAVRVINQHETPDFLVAPGVPRSKISYVPAFYIDLDIFKPQDEAIKQYDVVFVGRLARNKGIDLFLQAVKRAGLVGLVVGDGPLRIRAERFCRRNELKVNFHGFAKDAAEVAALINRSRILMMTSLNEGGPRVVLEALACGVPVVATPVGIVPDIMPPEAIEEWHVADLADKVRNILGDEALYARLREGGLAAVRQFERTAAITAYADAIKRFAA
jgi:glycosyltransferase involved in cell wall biosynthesis